MTIQKIKISPESTNYHDNEANVAYLYRGYIVWHDDSRPSLFDAWSFAPAVLRTPDASQGESFEPYWDDNGDVESGETRRACIAVIDQKFAEGTASPATRRNAWGRLPEPEADEDALPVTLTVTKSQARTILAALSRRCNELDILGGPDAEALSKETREIYQSVDGQVYGVKS